MKKPPLPAEVWRGVGFCFALTVVLAIFVVWAFS